MTPEPVPAWLATTPPIAGLPAHLPVAEIKGIARPAGLPQTCTDEELMEAVKVWMIGGEHEVLAGLLHVPVPAVKHWVKSRGWAEIVEHFKPEISGVLCGQMGRVGSVCLDQLEERVREGDPQYDFEGQLIGRKPIKAKELSQIAAQMFESKAKLEGRAGSLGEGEKIGLHDLMRSLKALAARDISGEAERV